MLTLPILIFGAATAAGIEAIKNPIARAIPRATFPRADMISPMLIWAQMLPRLPSRSRTVCVVPLRPKRERTDTVVAFRATISRAVRWKEAEQPSAFAVVGCRIGL